MVRPTRISVLPSAAMRCSTSFSAASVWARRLPMVLAGAFINDDGDDVGQLFALIGVEHGVGQGRQQQGKACDAHAASRGG